MKVNLDGYIEVKENRKKRVLWFFLNILLYPLLGNKMRSKFLRLMGAKIGKRCRLYRSVRYHAPWSFQIGDFVCIGPNVEIYNKASVIIGNNVVISQGSYLCTASHDISSPTMMLITKPIVIGDNVWIGAKANILPGVTIGEGAVVGACAVVAKDVPAWSVVIGNPAKVIKKRNLKEV